MQAVVRAAAGRLVLLYLPNYSPWLNPIEMLRRHLRREVTHCELFLTLKQVISASYDFFNLIEIVCYNLLPSSKFYNGGIAYFG